MFRIEAEAGGRASRAGPVGINGLPAWRYVLSCQSGEAGRAEDACVVAWDEGGAQSSTAMSVY